MFLLGSIWLKYVYQHEAVLFNMILPQCMRLAYSSRWGFLLPYKQIRTMVTAALVVLRAPCEGRSWAGNTAPLVLANLPEDGHTCLQNFISDPLHYGEAVRWSKEPNVSLDCRHLRTRAIATSLPAMVPGQVWTYQTQQTMAVQRKTWVLQKPNSNT